LNFHDDHDDPRLNGRRAPLPLVVNDRDTITLHVDDHGGHGGVASSGNLTGSGVVHVQVVSIFAIVRVVLFELFGIVRHCSALFSIVQHCSPLSCSGY